MSRFHRRLHELGFLTYEDYLASPSWKLTAARYRKRQCYCCGQTASLQVHHKSYARLGREKAADLVTVCRLCHKKIHSAVDRGQAILNVAHVLVKERLQKRKPKRRRLW